MFQTKSPPPLDGADGERHRRDAFDGRPNSHPDHVPQARNKARFQLLVSKLHALGPYPFYHFFDEIERGADVRDRVHGFRPASSRITGAMSSRLPSMSLLAKEWKDDSVRPRCCRKIQFFA
jgi:hypothetical protein